MFLLDFCGNNKIFPSLNFGWPLSQNTPPGIARVSGPKGCCDHTEDVDARRKRCGDSHGLHRLYLWLSVGAASVGDLALNDGADGSLQDPSQGGDSGWCWYPMIPPNADDDMIPGSGYLIEPRTSLLCTGITRY